MARKKQPLEQLQQAMRARHPQGAAGPGARPYPLIAITSVNWQAMECQITRSPTLSPAMSKLCAPTVPLNSPPAEPSFLAPLNYWLTT
jgi:hypothetical protein